MVPWFAIPSADPNCYMFVLGCVNLLRYTSVGSSLASFYTLSVAVVRS